MKPFLPFTRPAIDEQSIAAVAEVFRSGQLAAAPKSPRSKPILRLIWAAAVICG